jgi:hypothetical protein
MIHNTGIALHTGAPVQIDRDITVLVKPPVDPKIAV